jgi:hypothetical protein
MVRAIVAEPTGNPDSNHHDFCYANEPLIGKSHVVSLALPHRLTGRSAPPFFIRVHPRLKTSFDVRLKLSFPTCPNADT